jgi:hypothetical protein
MKNRIENIWYYHGFTIFVIVAIAIVLVLGFMIVNSWDKPSDTVHHYECYSGGALVVDQDFRLTKGGSLLDESGSRVRLKNLDCVVTR